MDWLDRISPHLHLVWHGETPPEWIDAPRRIYDHELIVCTKGSHYVETGSHRFECGPWSYIIIPPDCRHSNGGDGCARAYRYCFHFDWMPCDKPLARHYAAFVPARPDRGVIHFSPTFVPKGIPFGAIQDRNRARCLISMMTDEWRNPVTPTPVVSPACRGLLLELLLLCFAPDRKSPRPEQGISRAHAIRERLHQRLNENVAVPELLEDLGCRYEHLCRVFRKAYGLAPVAYRTALRMEKAQQLLREGKYRIHEVARMTGYDSSQYFARVYRKTMGRAPTEC